MVILIPLIKGRTVPNSIRVSNVRSLTTHSSPDPVVSMRPLIAKIKPSAFCITIDPWEHAAFAVCAVDATKHTARTILMYVSMDFDLLSHARVLTWKPTPRLVSVPWFHQRQSKTIKNKHPPPVHSPTQNCYTYINHPTPPHPTPPTRYNIATCPIRLKSLSAIHACRIHFPKSSSRCITVFLINTNSFPPQRKNSDIIRGTIAFSMYYVKKQKNSRPRN